jgi:hypothetical protein
MLIVFLNIKLNSYKYRIDEIKIFIPVIIIAYGMFKQA